MNLHKKLTIHTSAGTESNDTPRVNLLAGKPVPVVDTAVPTPRRGAPTPTAYTVARPSPTNSALVIPPDATTITVHGVEYELPSASDCQLFESAKIAESYAMQFLPGQEEVDHPPNLPALTGKLQGFRDQLSRKSAEGRALADAGNYEIDDARLNRDINQLRASGSFEALLREHHRKQQVDGMNPERIRHWLRDDHDMEKIIQICSEGVVADTDPEFTCTERLAPIRDLQRRLSPVYYKAAATMHDTSKVLLFRISDLTEDERRQIHMANEYHWRAEPGKVAGRPLMDCSNAAPGAIPLNTDTTKLKGIERYQRVKLPTFREVLTQWNKQRITAGLQWTDMWMFKADITGCFNQIHWTPTVSKLMGFMLNAFILMIMITCGFGVTVTPMAWSVVGDAMNRTVNKPNHPQARVHFRGRLLRFRYTSGSYDITGDCAQYHQRSVRTRWCLRQKECPRTKSRDTRHPRRLYYGHSTTQGSRHRKAVLPTVQHRHSSPATTAILAMPRIDHESLRTSYDRHDHIRDTNHTHDTQGPRKPEDQRYAQRPLRYRDMAGSHRPRNSTPRSMRSSNSHVSAGHIRL